MSDETPFTFAGLTPEQTEQMEEWEAKSAEYFTCQCNPPVVQGHDGLYHRVPIDCMTAEDWQRVARAKQERAVTVWVVEVNGDSDCGGPNDGAIAVYAHKSDAWEKAFMEAQRFINDREWDTNPEYNVTEDGINVYRGSFNVKEMHVN